MRTRALEFSRIRALPLVTAVVALATADASGAAAQNYPWCSNFSDGAGINCGFSTLAQCMATATGSGGTCSPNNLYRPPVAVTPRSHRAGTRQRHP